jgi:hypothetical protein
VDSKDSLFLRKSFKVSYKDSFLGLGLSIGNTLRKYIGFYFLELAYANSKIWDVMVI